MVNTQCDFHFVAFLYSSMGHEVLSMPKSVQKFLAFCFLKCWSMCDVHTNIRMKEEKLALLGGSSCHQSGWNTSSIWILCMCVLCVSLFRLFSTSIINEFYLFIPHHQFCLVFYDRQILLLDFPDMKSLFSWVLYFYMIDIIAFCNPQLTEGNKQGISPGSFQTSLGAAIYWCASTLNPRNLFIQNTQYSWNWKRAQDKYQFVDTFGSPLQNM